MRSRAGERREQTAPLFWKLRKLYPCKLTHISAISIKAGLILNRGWGLLSQTGRWLNPKYTRLEGSRLWSVCPSVHKYGKLSLGWQGGKTSASLERPTNGLFPELFFCYSHMAVANGESKHFRDHARLLQRGYTVQTITTSMTHTQTLAAHTPRQAFRPLLVCTMSMCW